MTVAIRPRSQSHYKQPIKKKDTLDHLRTNFIAKKKIQLHFQFLPFELTYSWNRSITFGELNLSYVKDIWIEKHPVGVFCVLSQEGMCL